MKLEETYYNIVKDFYIEYESVVDQKELIHICINFMSNLDQSFKSVLKQEKKTFRTNYLLKKIIPALELFIPLSYNESVLDGMINVYYDISECIRKYNKLNLDLYNFLISDDFEKNDIIDIFCLIDLVEVVYLVDSNKIKEYCELLEKNYESNISINNFSGNSLLVDELIEFENKKMKEIKGEKVRAR